MVISVRCFFIIVVLGIYAESAFAEFGTTDQAAEPTNSTVSEAAATAMHPSNKIIIAQNDAQPAGFEYRLKAELEAVGFWVIFKIVDRQHLDGESLAEVAKAEGAGAAILYRLKEGNIGVWVADRYTDKMVYRVIEIPADSAQADSLVARSTVELLRASLLEVNAGYRSKSGIPAPKEVQRLISVVPAMMPPAPLAPPVEPPALLDKAVLALGGIAVLADIGTAPVVDFSVRTDFLFRNHLVLFLDGALPLFRAQLESDSGKATVRIGKLGLGVGLWIKERDSKVGLQLCAGASSWFFRISGIPHINKTGHEGFWAIFAPELKLTIRIAFNEYIGLEVIGEPAVTVSRLVVSAGAENMATYGYFILSGGARLYFQI